MTTEMRKVVVCVFLLLLSSFAAEKKPNQGTSSEAQVAQQQIVLLPVQVQDNDGKPVRGLAERDFTLKIEGKPVPIQASVEVAGNAPASAGARSSKAPSAGQIYSNLPEGGMPQQLLIVAVDLINTGFIEKGEAQQQLLNYLIEGLPQQPFELVAITADGLVEIHSFDQTFPRADSSPGHTTEATDSTANSTQQRLTASEFSQLLKLSQVPRPPGLYSWEIAARASLTALRQLAEVYAGVPGRKTVIWLTAGIRAMGGDPSATARRRGDFQVYDKSPLATDPQLRTAYDEAFRALNTADMAVYPLDLKPMAGHKIYLTNSFGPAVGDGKNVSFTVGGFESSDGIKPLAAESGGRPCSISDPMKACIEVALNDSQNYYLLAFYVDPNEQKSGWHKLDASTTSGNSKVRTRSRFFVPTKSASGGEEIREYLMAVAKGNMNYLGLGFSLERLPNSPPPADDPIRIRLRVPASSVLLPPGETKLSYEIATVALSNEGELTHAVRVVPFDLTEEQTQAALVKGWRIDEPWPLDDSTAALRYIIREKRTGKTGSVTIPLSKPTTPK